MSLKALIHTINAVKRGDNETFEYRFEQIFNETLIAMEQQERQGYPTDYFRPSSIYGCKRMLYYMRKGYPLDEERPDVGLIGICQSGEDTHKRIQGLLRRMDGVRILDVEDVVEDARRKGINTTFLEWNRSETEARCKNDDWKFFFQADGVFRFDSKEVLLEIKSIHMQGFTRLIEPKPEHLMQATCYAMGLGLDYILFVYEDRNFANRKFFLVEVTEEMRQKVIDKVNAVSEYLESDTLPPKEDDKCQYCRYKVICSG